MGFSLSCLCLPLTREPTQRIMPMMYSLDGPDHLATDDGGLRQIVTASADGMIVVDGDGCVRFLNPAATTILGRQAHDLLGQAFGYPMLGGERAEIDLIHPDGSSLVAEMRVVDTDWGGAPARLVSLRDITEHRRAHQALRDAEAFNWAILNALSVHLAVLDARGTIIAINDAWREFARINGDPDLRWTGVGGNYFNVCQHAADESATEASAVLQGMRAVLDGHLPSFELEYPCHSPEEERWFVLRVVPLRGQRTGLVVSHTNVTAQRRTARLAAEATVLRERLQLLERELEAVERMAAPAPPPPAQSLHQRRPHLFSRAVEEYCLLLDQALLSRHGSSNVVHEGDLRGLGEQLGVQMATPRDLVAIHLAAIRAVSIDAPPTRQQAYLGEGRLMLLELMGHLAAYYRARAHGRSGEADDNDVVVT